MVEAAFDDGVNQYYIRNFPMDYTAQRTYTASVDPGNQSYIASFETDNDTQTIVGRSQTSKLALHIMVYNDKAIIGCFHALLPTIFINNGQPPELALGQSQQLKFDTYNNVLMIVNPNISPN